MIGPAAAVSRRDRPRRRRRPAVAGRRPRLPPRRRGSRGRRQPRRCSRPPSACAACSTAPPGSPGIAGRLLLSPRLEGVHAQVAAEERGVRVDGPRAARPGRRARRVRARRSPSASRAARPASSRFPASTRWRRSPSAPAAPRCWTASREALPHGRGHRARGPARAARRTRRCSASRPARPRRSSRWPRARATRRRTRESLARLQGPVSDRLGGGPFEQRELRGADAFTLHGDPRARAVLRGLEGRRGGLHGELGSRAAPPGAVARDRAPPCWRTSCPRRARRWRR